MLESVSIRILVESRSVNIINYSYQFRYIYAKHGYPMQKSWSQLLTITCTLLVYRFESLDSLSFDQVEKRLPLIPPVQILEDDVCYTLSQARRLPADMRRDEDIRSLPQRVALGQRLRVGDIQSGTAHEARLESLDESGRVDDGTARHVDEEGLLLAEDLELLGADAPLGLGAHGQAEQDDVQVLAEEVVDGLGAGAGEPLGGDQAVRVAGAGDVVFGELLGLGRGARAGGLDVDFHAEGVGDAGNLTADGAVSQDAPGLFHFIDERVKNREEGRRRLTCEGPGSRLLCRSGPS